MCHELGHAYCSLNNKYPIFHSSRENYLHLNEKEFLYISRNLKRTALRAEQYTDKMGEVILKKHFPELNIKYVKFYDREKPQKRLKNTIEEYLAGIISHRGLIAYKKLRNIKD